MPEQNLWAPWRMSYLQEADGPGGAPGTPGGAGGAAAAGAFLTAYWTHPQDDDRNFVIHRNVQGMILLNRYPYANGHLMVALGEARPTLSDYEPEQRTAFWRLVERAWALIERTLNPQGINMGINQGRAAGAGVPGHLHAHLVPRWAGDTNFMTVVGQVRVIPDSLQAMADKYRRMLDQAPG